MLDAVEDRFDDAACLDKSLQAAKNSTAAIGSVVKDKFHHCDVNTVIFGGGLLGLSLVGPSHKPLDVDGVLDTLLEGRVSLHPELHSLGSELREMAEKGIEIVWVLGRTETMITPDRIFNRISRHNPLYSKLVVIDHDERYAQNDLVVDNGTEVDVFRTISPANFPPFSYFIDRARSSRSTLPLQVWEDERQYLARFFRDRDVSVPYGVHMLNFSASDAKELLRSTLFGTRKPSAFRDVPLVNGTTIKSISAEDVLDVYSKEFSAMLGSSQEFVIPAVHSMVKADMVSLEEALGVGPEVTVVSGGMRGFFSETSRKGLLTSPGGYAVDARSLYYLDVDFGISFKYSPAEVRLYRFDSRETAHLIAQPWRPRPMADPLVSHEVAANAGVCHTHHQHHRRRIVRFRSVVFTLSPQGNHEVRRRPPSSHEAWRRVQALAKEAPSRGGRDSSLTG